MSRWLNSVNHLLEKLDDQVEANSSGGASVTATTAAAAAKLTRQGRRMTLLGRQQRGGNSSDEYDEYEEGSINTSDEEEFYDDEQESYDDEDEDDYGEEVDDDEDEEEEDYEEEAVFQDAAVAGAKQTQLQVKEDAAHGIGEDSNIAEEKIMNDEAISEVEATAADHSNRSDSDFQESSHTSKRDESSTTRNNARQQHDTAIAELEKAQQQENKRLLKDLKDLKEQFRKERTELLARNKKELKKVAQENGRLVNELKELQDQLATDRAELLAQHDELEQAAARMEQDRQRSKEEREDLLEEQEEEIQQLREHYEMMLADQKEHYETEMHNLHARVKLEEQKRLEEGGDWTKELEDALERERNALKELVELKADKNRLESTVTKLETQLEALQTKVVSLTATAREASDRERDAEDKLDSFMTQHQRQLQQKQERESELERTVAELGAALTFAQQKNLMSNRSAPVGENTAENFKAKLTATVEEMESFKAQISFLEQERDALQHELHEISREREEDAAEAQEREREHDKQTTELKAQVSKLEETLQELKRDDRVRERSATIDPNSSARMVQLTDQLEEARRQLSLTSDELIRQKGQVESSKAEIITLKGRLESATARAENAENALSSPAASTSRLYDIESGGFTTPRSRRRVRGGRGRYSQLPSRSLLSAFGLNVAHGSATEQAVRTIDAMDAWMLETVYIMRHEPLARLGFAFYMIMVHLWCFSLVFFHTVESEHGNVHIRGLK